MPPKDKRILDKSLFSLCLKQFKRQNAPHDKAATMADCSSREQIGIGPDRDEVNPHPHNPMSQESHQKLSFKEKAGYSAADAAANFVFMTMILFQTNFYTDTFGLTASAAAAILLWPRLWDAFFDPVMGVLADRTSTRWGKFRPWILWTAVPWAIVMVLAYTTPKGWSLPALIAYAVITNTMLMTLYSMNNMPYSALGGVMTADLNERAKLNSFRFVSVNIAQFIVGGFTLTLVAKFAEGRDRAHGWQMTMGIWAVLCLILFLITFSTTKERIKPISEVKTSPRQDFSDLIKNSPWRIMWLMTMIHFGILSLRGGANYSYYHHYADKAAMFDVVEKLGLTGPALDPGAPRPGGILEILGCIVHGSRDNMATSNVADVFNSIINMTGTATTIIVIFLSVSFARRFGKKAVAITGFALSAVNAFATYLLRPTDVYGMIALTIVGSVVYAPTIPLVWAIFADCADYSEWKTGRRFTGIVFATLGFALKAGLALGSAGLLWILSGFFGYDTKFPTAPQAIAGYRVCVGIVVGIMFAMCTVLLMRYKLNKNLTIQMADELAERRRKAAASDAKSKTA
jgi:Na+/melibiose symporter-like transporter